MGALTAPRGREGGARPSLFWAPRTGASVVSRLLVSPPCPVPGRVLAHAGRQRAAAAWMTERGLRGEGRGRERTAEPTLGTQGPSPVDGSHASWSWVRPVPPLTRPRWLSPAGTGTQPRSAQSFPSSCLSDKRARGLDEEPHASRAVAGLVTRPRTSWKRTGPCRLDVTL